MNHPITIRRVIITLKRIFLPWLYWRDRYLDEVTNTYHPEFGTYWQPKESGGLLIMQAQDEGYKLGYQDATKHIVGMYASRESASPLKSDYVYDVRVFRGSDTRPHIFNHILNVLQATEGWEVVGMYFATEPDNGFNRIVVGPNPNDLLTVHLRRVKVS